MKKENIFKTLSDYKKILENQGYNVIYIGLYGSQNYNVDDDYSDVDAKAIILPTLHDIIFRKVTSKTIECENGTIDVKDLITFYDVIKKGNFSYIECVDTEYSIGDKYIKELFSQFRPNFKSIVGAMYEKRKALTHEYPSKTEEFKKFGCDPKQYHHIIRLYDLLSYNIENSCNKSYLKYEENKRNLMIKIKREMNGLTVEDLEKESDLYIEKARALLEYNEPDYSYEYIDIDDEVNKYIEDKLKLELIRNSKVISAREVRTFDNSISKKDIEKFPILKEYQGKDISYIVYESLEIL